MIMFRRHRLSTVIFVTLTGGAAPFSIAAGPDASPAGSSVEFREEAEEAAVYWQGDKIVELVGSRALRFRAQGFNDHWVGTAARRMDLGWASSDLNDYVPAAKQFDQTPGGFSLELEGLMPGVDGRVSTRFEGIFVSRDAGFRYILSSRIIASQEKWRRASRYARGRSRDEPLFIRPLNFHLNRITPAEIASLGNEPGDLDLYDGMVLSEDGVNWRFIPKIPVPYVIREGFYETTHWNHGREVAKGQRIGYLDRREGGWMTEMLEASAPLKLEMCWMFSDVHHRFPHGVPPWVQGKDDFEASYKMAFAPVDAARARSLLEKAEPIDWRDRREFQLPVFSRFSTFDRLISGSNEYAWLASTYHCAVDDTLGYDDNHSIRINHDDPADVSAWYAWTWGPEYETMRPLEGAYRFSAMVKTRGATGAFRLAVAEFIGDSWRRNGAWTNRPVWHYSSQEVTGATDWTRVWVDLPIDNKKFHTDRPDRIRRSIVLEYKGAGSIWFDNVRIQRIE